jgi:hypothetical protein
LEDNIKMYLKYLLCEWTGFMLFRLGCNGRYM